MIGAINPPKNETVEEALVSKEMIGMIVYKLKSLYQQAVQAPPISAPSATPTKSSMATTSTSSTAGVY